MVALPLGPQQQLMVVASPALLAGVGAPRNPRDLMQMPCVRLPFSAGGRPARGVEKGGGKRAGWCVKAPLRGADCPLTRGRAGGGVGFVSLYAPNPGEALASGALV